MLTRLPEPARAPRFDRSLGAMHRRARQHRHAGALSPLAGCRGPGRLPSRRAGGDHPVDRLLQRESEIPARHREGPRVGARRRGPAFDGGPPRSARGVRSAARRRTSSSETSGERPTASSWTPTSAASRGVSAGLAKRTRPRPSATSTASSRRSAGPGSATRSSSTAGVSARRAARSASAARSRTSVRRSAWLQRRRKGKMRKRERGRVREGFL